jgi:hypothetical protein
VQLEYADLQRHQRQSLAARAKDEGATRAYPTVIYVMTDPQQSD